MKQLSETPIPNIYKKPYKSDFSFTKSNEIRAHAHTHPNTKEVNELRDASDILFTSNFVF